MISDAVCKINKLLSFAVNNQHSHFYRTKYNAAGLTGSDLQIRDIMDIQKFPLLIKDELRDLSSRGEFFVPESEIKGIKYSTGTTGQPLISFYRKTDYLDELTNIACEDELVANIKKAFCLMTAKSIPPFWERLVKKFGKQLIVGELSNLSLSAALFAATKPEMLICPTKKLFAFAKMLSREDRERVTFLQTKGDKVSACQKTALSGYFPNASHLKMYTPTDAVALAIPCPELLNDAYLYHASEYVLLEIIDVDTAQPLPDGEMGEIVATRFQESRPVIPLIRYRTGDFGMWIGGDMCVCGRKKIKMTGRIKSSISKFGKYVYFRENLEQALIDFSSLLAGNATLEINRIDGDKLLLFLETKKELSDAEKKQITDDLLNRALLRALPVSGIGEKPEFSFRNLLNCGTLAEFSVQFVKELDTASSKYRDIVEKGAEKPLVCVY